MERGCLVLTLRPDKLAAASIPVSTGWLLGDCMEAKGKQDLWIRQKPEALAVLRQQTIIQSAQSSNRIEGVTIPADRLRPVVLGKSRPRDRSEEEVAGYRKALDWIFSRKRPVSIDPAVILHLHAMAQGGASGDAGRWKARDNEIIEILPSGERRIRFKATSARKTPAAVKTLGDNYRQAVEAGRIPPLLVVATFVFDLLCIHPFRDGNGRVSRLLTTLLLGQHGFAVSRYISLERLVEESKDDYYGVLAKCSHGWHDGANEIVPWWNYFLGILRRAYLDLARQVESGASRPVKGDLVRQAVAAQAGPFSLADLRCQMPAVSAPLIKKVLAEMKKAGHVRLVGHGRGATWENAG
jgi:Fic family protein